VGDKRREPLTYEKLSIFLYVIIRSFGGWADEKTDIKEASELAASLPPNASYVKDFYYFGGYDAPFTIFHRHNEIWFIAE
jgi:hypothetical protein